MTETQAPAGTGTGAAGSEPPPGGAETTASSGIVETTGTGGTAADGDAAGATVAGSSAAGTSASARTAAAAGKSAASSSLSGADAAGATAAAHTTGGATVDTDLPEPAAALRPKRGGQLARIAFLVLTLAAGAYAVADQWSKVRSGFSQLGVLPMVFALLPALASVLAMMLAWRGLLGSLGSPLRFRPAARIFFTSQLGKYLPGAVWPMVAQMQLGRAFRIPRARSVAAAALAMLISLGSALVLAAGTLPLGGGAHATGYWWAFLAVPVLLAGLHPKVANPALRTLFRVTRRPPIEPLTGRTIAEAALRSVAGWLLAGLHIWILALALGASPWRALMLGIGGYAFAWSVGFLIVFAPAGAGVREIILVASLSPVLDKGDATVVALASRLITIVADLIAAAVTARGEKEGGDAARGDDDEAGLPASA